MQNILLCIGYEGTHFQGYQKQSPERHVRTIQQVLEEALMALYDTTIKTHAAGRTDSGVHAITQYVNFKIDHTHIVADKISYALNTKLPADIRVFWSVEVDMEFHARYSAISRTYFYQIYEGYVVPPVMQNFVHNVPVGIDWSMIEDNLATCIGMHDFAVFSVYNDQITNTVRTVIDTNVVEYRDGIKRIFISANGFLWKMVRTIVGTCLYYAINNTDIKHFVSLKDILACQDSTLVKNVAPAKGLFLYDITYKDSYGFPPPQS